MGAVHSDMCTVFILPQTFNENYGREGEGRKLFSGARDAEGY